MPEQKIIADCLYQHTPDIRRAAGMAEFVYAMLDDQGNLFHRDTFKPFFPAKYYRLVRSTTRGPEQAE